MKKLDRLLKEWIGAFGIAVVLVAILSWIIWPMHVDGHSMDVTLSNGDVIFVSKIWTQLKSPKRGDLIVVNIVESGKREKIVKRVIGTPGDHVVIKDGVVSINAKVLVEPYASSETIGNTDLYVPQNAYFLLGDNRKISKDSRSFGCIFKKNIKGKLIFKKSY